MICRERGVKGVVHLKHPVGPPGPLGGEAGCRFCLMAGTCVGSVKEFKLKARYYKLQTEGS